MTAENVPITVEQGANFILNLIWYANDGVTPIDLTGYTGKFQVRENYSEADGFVLLEAATVAGGGNGFMTLGGALGTIDINCPAANTTSIPSGRYVYDIELTSGSGTIYRLVRGAVNWTPGVTV